MTIKAPILLVPLTYPRNAYSQIHGTSISKCNKIKLHLVCNTHSKNRTNNIGIMT